MNRGRTQKGRLRPGNLVSTETPSRQLLRTTDHGDPIIVREKDLGLTGDRWVEPFLDANRSTLARLSLRPEVRVDPRPSVLLHPGPKVGAIPLLNPSTRRVAAGLLVEPRFRWVALGSVFNAIGFSVEPSLGGGALVPGSAREVPPWILAGPVLQRLAALLNHRRRGFIERSESRASPRGRVDWTRWASLDVPHGRWTTFPCTFSDPDDDPSLMAAVRWTLARIGDELAAIPWSLPARTLLERTAELQVLAGTGVALRPSPFWSPLAESDWVLSAVEAMGWVAEERGLGGSRTLDGLAWDLSIDEVWEAWVAAFAADLARQLGMTASTFKSVRRPLRWSGPVRSMGSLAPDIELRNPERVIWIDAKYKAHLELLGRHGWEGLKEEVREQHRADLHQALAYASLADAPLVDTVLIYPQIGDQTQRTTTIASVTSGRRRVRIFLASLPFGYRHPEHRTACLSSFSELYSA